MDRAHVSVKINRFVEDFDRRPPWFTGLRRLFLNTEIVGSSPVGAGLCFIFFFLVHISNVLTFAHGMLC